MFTGLIEEVGTVRAAGRVGDGYQLQIEALTVLDGVKLGDSIAVDGVCLTVIARDKASFTVGLAPETLAKTDLGEIEAGGHVNLERAVLPTTRLGGHYVQGHVDGVGKLVERRPDGGSVRLGFEAPAELARFIAPKGSVAIDGVSLTVNEVSAARFGVNIIPITLRETNMGALAVGDRVNLEIDLLARYVARLMDKDAA